MKKVRFIIFIYSLLFVFFSIKFYKECLKKVFVEKKEKETTEKKEESVKVNTEEEERSAKIIKEEILKQSQKQHSGDL